MTSRLGVEIGARHLRAVKVEGVLRRTVRSAQVEWEGDGIHEAVARIENDLGGARQVAIALDMALLFTKEVALPALSAAEKVGILALEPERYFPVRGEELLIAARARDGLVFAARESTVAAAVDAVARLGAVDRVEPAPHALARAMSRLGVRAGTVVSAGKPRGASLTRLEDGTVAGVRWLYDGLPAVRAAIDESGGGLVYATGFTGSAGADGGPLASPRPLPTAAGLRDEFLPAYGAALGIGAPLGETLVPPELARRVVAGRRRRRAIAAAVVAASAVFAIVSIDRAMADVAAGLTARADSLSRAAGGAMALQAERDALDRRMAAVSALSSSRADPLAALAALGRRLPPDAYLRTLRVSGTDWQADGYASDAARLVPMLEGAPEFEGVRFLTATTTERVGSRNHESFSIAFRLAGKP